MVNITHSVTLAIHCLLDMYVSALHLLGATSVGLCIYVHSTSYMCRPVSGYLILTAGALDIECYEKAM